MLSVTSRKQMTLSIMAADAAVLVLCRLCGTECSSKHSWSLTSDSSVKKQLLQRIKYLILIDVCIELKDGLSNHICRQCKRKFEKMERAADDLRKFKSMVREVNASISTLKKNKETSGVVNVSLTHRT